MITPEYEMKQSNIEKVRGVYDYSKADTLISYCKKNNVLVRGHTLLYAGRSLPEWMNHSELQNDTIMGMLKKYITDVASHFSGKLYCWDVVNEAIDNNGKMYPNILYAKFGESYIDSAFAWAHRADPSTKLFYNDYFTNYGNDEYKVKLELAYNLLSRLKKSQIQVDGIGLQMHVDINESIDYGYMKTILNKFEALGLEIHFTEVDVAIDTPFTAAKYLKQAEVYAKLAKLCISSPGCKAFITWGFTDLISWIPSYYSGKKGAACLLDASYNSKPAVDSIIKTLDIFKTSIESKKQSQQLKILNTNIINNNLLYTLNGRKMSSQIIPLFKFTNSNNNSLLQPSSSHKQLVNGVYVIQNKN
jgi:endo-1,4-beta-xylanase